MPTSAFGDIFGNKKGLPGLFRGAPNRESHREGLMALSKRWRKTYPAWAYFYFSEVFF